jgi:hypothetical protein
MNKLLLSLLLACIATVAGCGDREQYTAHRAERSKPKMEVGANVVSVRRAPYPNLDILPDGRLRVDDIEIPLDDGQRELLRTSFVKLQILRQNTLTESSAPADASRRTIPLDVPAGQTPFPPDLAERIPEFKQYSEALANPRALR